MKFAVRESYATIFRRNLYITSVNLKAMEEVKQSFLDDCQYTVYKPSSKIYSCDYCLYGQVPHGLLPVHETR
jgi:hypothetical protein